MGVLRTKLVRIGNSQGIRIPRLLVRQAGLTEQLELEPGKGRLIVRSALRPREQWDDQFRAMAARRDDGLILGKGAGLTSWDNDEWTW